MFVFFFTTGRERNADRRNVRRRTSRTMCEEEYSCDLTSNRWKRVRHSKRCERSFGLTRWIFSRTPAADYEDFFPTKSTLSIPGWSPLSISKPPPDRKPLKFHRRRRFFLNPHAYESCCIYDDGLFETKRNGRNDKLSQDSPMRRRRPYMFRVKFEIHNANIIRFVYFICTCICIRRAKFPHTYTSMIPV